MISSVIAKLNCDRVAAQRVIEEITSHPELSVGELIDGRMLPITIDSHDNVEMETTTRWILAVDGVIFVDVVFVHFEEGDGARGVERKETRASAAR